MNHGQRRTAATPEYLYADFRPGQRVTSIEGFPGVVTEVLEGPGNNTIVVRLDNGMGGGAYRESELTSLNTTKASGSHTADQDYPELGTILTDRPDLKASITEDEYLGRRSASLKTADYYLDTPASTALSELAGDILSASNAALERVVSPYDTTPDMRFEPLTAAMIPAMPEWAILSQFTQYPQDGPDGISYFKGVIDADRHVDCLLLRQDGKLVGVLNHYPIAFPEADEQKGNVTLLVLKPHRRTGVGTALLNEAIKRWNVNLKRQDTTPGGRGLIDSLGSLRSRSALVHCDTCDVEYAIDSMDEVHDHSKTAEWSLSLPLDLSKGTDGESRSAQPGYSDGFSQAKSSQTREPKSNDSQYRANFAQGWADGVLARPPEVEQPKTDPSDLGTDADGAPKMASLDAEAGIVDFLIGSPKPSKTWAGPGHNWSFDWCRFRKNSRCMYPKELNKAATEEAGYAVWIPEDRGYCPRIDWEDQKTCTVGEPGQNVPGGFLNATVPWEEGGQHNGMPESQRKKHSALTATAEKPMWWDKIDWELEEQVDTSCLFAIWRGRGTVGRIEWANRNNGVRQVKDEIVWIDVDDQLRRQGLATELLRRAREINPAIRHSDRLSYSGDGFARSVAALTATLGFEFTAAWNDVRAKAKAIRQAGGVRFISVLPDGIVSQVNGLNFVYQCEVQTVPGSYAVSHWKCACPWGAYSWGRTGPWRKYEGRMCCHALATVYEAQSKGMFGKTVKEDPHTPKWMPAPYKVKLDGDWSRDKGRYASVEDDGAWDMVALMLSTGAPVVEVHTALFKMGISQHVASYGPLKGKVNGQVKDLVFSDGEVLSGGKPVSGPVLYPTYSPNAGLNFVAALVVREACLLRMVAAGDDMQVAAEAMMELAIKNEPATTSLMRSLASRFAGKLVKLDKRLKSLSSLLRKMRSVAHEFDGDAGRCALNMSDTLRYTMVSSVRNYVTSTKDSIAAMESAGYGTRVKNFWERGDAYQGINVAAMTPSGHPFELQFHTPESLKVKNANHPLYEKFRESELNTERRALYEKMAKRSHDIMIPGGVNLIMEPKFVPYRDVYKAASMGTYRYLILHTLISAHPTTIMREYLGDDDYRIEVWKDGCWVMDNEYARFTILGDGRTDEIT